MEILLGEIFLLGGGNLRRSDFDHWKINMTCVYKKYKIKNIAQELKVKFLLGYNMKGRDLTFGGKEIKLWGSSTGGRGDFCR